MRSMEEKILTEGRVLSEDILKVGSFLNQQIDTEFLEEMACEIARLFEGEEITKILTIESSGIAMAAATGIKMHVPVVFAKKHKTSNVDGETYEAEAHSFTHGEDYIVQVSRDYLCAGERVLLVDDFLASGNALVGLVDLVRQAGGVPVGAAVAIEKKFQGGGDALREAGIRVEALAMIEKMSEGKIEFA